MTSNASKALRSLGAIRIGPTTAATQYQTRLPLLHDRGEYYEVPPDVDPNRFPTRAETVARKKDGWRLVWVRN